MSNKTIAQLTAKTPLYNDLVPVADPITGVAGKAGLLETVMGEIIDPPFTFSPEPNPLYFCYRGNFTNRFVYQPRGKFALKPVNEYFVNEGGSQFAISASIQEPENNVTSLTIHGKSSTIQGLNGGSSFTGYHNIVSFSAPNLESGTFQLQNFYSLSSISCPELAIGFFDFSNLNNFAGTLSFPKLKTGGFLLSGPSKITTLNLPELVNGIYDLKVNAGNAASIPFISSINAPKMKCINKIDLSLLPLLTTVSFPELEFINPDNNNNFNTQYATTINLPKLKFTGNIFNQSNTTMPLTNFDINSLVWAMNGLFGFSTNITFPNLTTINAPEFVYNSMINKNTSGLDAFTYSMWNNVSLVNIASAPSLTTVNFPKLRFSGGSPTINIASAPALTTFTINQTPSFIGGNFVITNAALNQASVDGILTALAYLNGTVNSPYAAYSNKTVNLSGGTSATPSATGLAAKATLVARGCTVTHN